jgi:hypothetical protein
MRAISTRQASQRTGLRQWRSQGGQGASYPPGALARRDGAPRWKTEEGVKKGRQKIKVHVAPQKKFYAPPGSKPWLRHWIAVGWPGPFSALFSMHFMYVTTYATC